MQTSPEDAGSGVPPIDLPSNIQKAKGLLGDILGSLDEAKAEHAVTIDLNGKSSIGDFMVVASGRSHRHVGAVADQLVRHLKELGYGRFQAEGLDHCDWVLIDAGDIIVHIFKPEVREFYNLEKMWSVKLPEETLAP